MTDPTDTGHPTDPGAGDSGGGERPRGLLVAAAVVVLLLGVSLVVLLLHRGSGSPGGQGPAAAAPASPAAPSAAVTSPAPPPSAPAAASAADQQPLTAAPAGVRWELFQGVALPTRGTDGPTRISGSVHAGFSHTATGALLAAAQIAGRSLIDPSLAGLRQIGEQQLAAGAGQSAYLALVASFTDNNPPPAGYAQYAGFRYLAYTPDLAVVSLATRSNSGALQVGTDTLRWVDGDWRLELPATGLQQPQVVQDLDGYIRWQGVS